MVLFIEARAMAIKAVVTFLCCLTKVRILFRRQVELATYFTLSTVYHILGLAVELTRNGENLPINDENLSVVTH